MAYLSPRPSSSAPGRSAPNWSRTRRSRTGSAGWGGGGGGVGGGVVVAGEAGWCGGVPAPVGGWGRTPGGVARADDDRGLAAEVAERVAEERSRVTPVRSVVAGACRSVSCAAL